MNGTLFQDGLVLTLKVFPEISLLILTPLLSQMSEKQDRLSLEGLKVWLQWYPAWEWTAELGTISGIPPGNSAVFKSDNLQARNLPWRNEAVQEVESHRTKAWKEGQVLSWKFFWLHRIHWNYLSHSGFNLFWGTELKLYGSYLLMLVGTGDSAAETIGSYPKQN